MFGASWNVRDHFMTWWTALGTPTGRWTATSEPHSSLSSRLDFKPTGAVAVGLLSAGPYLLVQVIALLLGDDSTSEHLVAGPLSVFLVGVNFIPLGLETHWRQCTAATGTPNPSRVYRASAKLSKQGLDPTVPIKRMEDRERDQGLPAFESFFPSSP